MLDKRDATLSSSTEATSSASSINVTSNSNLTNLRIVQSLNYHGNQLTSFLKDLPEFRNLDLRTRPARLRSTYEQLGAGPHTAPPVLRVRVRVDNTGVRAGDDIVFVLLEPPNAGHAGVGAMTG